MCESPEMEFKPGELGYCSKCKRQQLLWSTPKRPSKPKESNKNQQSSFTKTNSTLGAAATGKINAKTNRNFIRKQNFFCQCSISVEFGTPEFCSNRFLTPANKTDWQTRAISSNISQFGNPETRPLCAVSIAFLITNGKRFWLWGKWHIGPAATLGFHNLDVVVGGVDGKTNSAAAEIKCRKAGQ